jgi:hypothetical protein
LKGIASQILHKLLVLDFGYSDGRDDIMNKAILIVLRDVDDDSIGFNVCRSVKMYGEVERYEFSWRH